MSNCSFWKPRHYRNGTSSSGLFGQSARPSTRSAPAQLDGQVDLFISTGHERDVVVIGDREAFVDFVGGGASKS